MYTHCRVTRACNSWLWCDDKRGCLVHGGARLSKASCLMWRMDMLPQPQPDADTPPELVALDMYNHTVGFRSGCYNLHAGL